MTHLVVVCTGNVARSPAAAMLLWRGLGHLAGLEIDSAGTNAVVGAQMDPYVAYQLRSAGVPYDEDFTAQQLTEAHLDKADLVLTMTKSQRAQATTMVPSAVRRTFTLLEFAALLELTGNEAFSSPSDVARHRGDLTLRRIDYDVPDPYGRSGRRHKASFALIEDSVRVISKAARDGRIFVPHPSQR